MTPVQFPDSLQHIPGYIELVIHYQKAAVTTMISSQWMNDNLCLFITFTNFITSKRECNVCEDFLCLQSDTYTTVREEQHHNSIQRSTCYFQLVIHQKVGISHLFWILTWSLLWVLFTSVSIVQSSVVKDVIACASRHDFKSSLTKSVRKTTVLFISLCPLNIHLKGLLALWDLQWVFLITFFAATTSF